MNQGFRSHRFAAAALVTVVASMFCASVQAIELNRFLRERGHGDVSVSYTTEGYEKFWVGDMKVADPGVGDVDTQSWSLWFAYGLTDRITLIGELPYVNTEGDGFGNFKEKDWQDLSLLAAGRLFSFGSKVQSDFVGAAGFRTIASNYVANSPVDVGDGTADWLFRVVYLLRYRGFYFSQQVGYDLRGGDAPNGYPLYTEVGQTWGPVTATALYAHMMANGGTDIGDPGFTFPSNGDEYERVGVKVYGRICSHFGVSGMYFTTLDGRNTGDTSGFSLGVNASF